MLTLPRTRTSASSFLLAILTVPAALVVGGCSSSNDGGAGSSGNVGDPLRTYVAYVRSNGIASVFRGNEALQTSFQIINEAEGGMAFDYLGNLYQADLRGGDGGAILVMNQASSRSYGNDLGSLNPAFDREIFGFSTTLDEPRSVALAHEAGLVFVTDTGDSSIKVFGSSGGGDIPPLFTAMTAAAPWDLAYDEAADRLYATLADGTIALFDNFVATRPAGETGSITPSADGLTPTGVDLRGIALLPHGAGVGVVVSDFGLDANGVDGAIYVFDDLSAAAGLVRPDQMLRGATAGLRDPIDLVVSADGFLRVVDAGPDRVLVFPAGGERRFASAPGLSKSFENPRAIAIEPRTPVVEFSPASDLDAPVDPVLEIVALTAPAGMNGEVLRLAADLLTAPTAAFDPGLPARGLGLDVFGNVYTTFTQAGGAGPEGGVRVLNRVALERGTGADLAYDPSRDRALEIEGNPFFPVPKPVAPTALDVDEPTSLIVLSDPARPGIWSFGILAGPASEEISVVDTGMAVGSAEPRGLDYDAGTDTLYAAISNGTIYVYESFRGVMGESPDRTITPADSIGASQVSTSLAGLVHDRSRNLLIVSDVGAAAGAASDGALYVFDVVSGASGLTSPIATITGASTGLDEPVSIAWNGSSLWVADQENGTISRFDDFLTLDGDVAPTATLAVPDVISVSVKAQGLAPTSGGSIGQ
ncbi:MAG: hypothetical protein ACJAQ3_002102 [Planctomycetota bacterium]